MISHNGWGYAQNNHYSGIIPGMGSPNERRRYNVTPSLGGLVHTQNNHCGHIDETVHERRSSIANVLALRLSCTKLSMFNMSMIYAHGVVTLCFIVV